MNFESFSRHSNTSNRQEDSTARTKKKASKKPKSNHTIIDRDQESEGAISSGERKPEQRSSPKRPITNIPDSESESELSEDESY